MREDLGAGGSLKDAAGALDEVEKGTRDAALVGSFYERLKESGVGEEMAEAISHDYATHLFFSSRMRLQHDQDLKRKAGETDGRGRR